MKAKVVGRYQAVLICWIPIINLITLFYLLIDRKIIHAFLWIVGTVVVMTALGITESKIVAQYYKENFNLDSTQQVVETKSKDISREFPQFNYKSTTRVFPDQLLRDGIYEFPMENEEGGSLTAKVVVESRQVKSYLVYDESKNLVEDRLDDILDEQIKAYEQQNPGKKIIYGDLKPNFSLPLYLNFLIASYLVTVFFVFYLMWTKPPLWLRKANEAGSLRTYEKLAHNNKRSLFLSGKARPKEFIPSKVLAKYIKTFPEESFPEFDDSKSPEKSEISI